MIEKELQIIKETEEKCKEILTQVEDERVEMIQLAHKEAQKRYHSIVKNANDQGEQILVQIETKLNASNSLNLKSFENEILALRQKGSVRVDTTAKKIFEGMWMCGNSKDVQL